MSGDYIELTGDDIPYHLRPDALPLAECDECHRQTWNSEAVDTICLMPQPDGTLCLGVFK